MNMPVFALLAFLVMALGGTVALVVHHGNVAAEQQLRCVAANGKPMRVDGTTYCLNPVLFVPN